MNDFQICISGICIGISAWYKQVERSCAEYICEDCKEVFHVQITEEDLKKEKAYYKKRNKSFNAETSEWRLEFSALNRKVAEEMIDYNRILIHGSALSLDGNGYFFIAPSGTGKSTHAALWRKVFGEKVTMVNDDKPLVKVENDEITIYGTPWDGKHRLSSNTGVLLKGICRIYRNKDNRIERLGKEEAMARLLEQTYRSDNAERVLKTLGMLKEIVDHIPVYALYCNMEEDAVFTAYKSLIKGERE